MAKCKECSNSFGLLELKKGICKQCIQEITPSCSDCNRCLNENEQGICSECQWTRKHKTLERNEVRYNNKISEIMLTTETVPNLEIIERIEVISAECVFGMNIFKDVLAGIRDIVGGRSKVTQNVLKDARKAVLEDLKKNAFEVGANAVVAVDLDYNDFGSMLLVVATGTAVKVKVDSSVPA